MNAKVMRLVTQLGLIPHPEGGFYKEVYRSETELSTAHGKRSLSTSIYFLLTSDNCSKFHQIQSDELWFWHEGDPITIHTLGDDGYQTLSLGPSKFEGHQPFQLVKGGLIFGSTVDTPGGFTLVSCVVSPGFDFAEFKLFSKEELLKAWPLEEKIISRLT
ncbi:cupin domain-containing protein [Mongoliitalea daihaiensis]|uniref:cupin domain-containing protein n=1 Tax=Mongoliitalea daihaiensis TaxID=2782006 RepID=UPI001F48D375|nr:cupin domain-containing protein [Mongoliitalea daihaiensis]UJP66201.1 cupin domain-containing protein [Mongoliitalea daihaiensis]